MRAYTIRRVFLLIPTLFLVTIATFLLVRFMPGDIIDAMVREHMEEQSLSEPLNVERLRHMMGLDKPIHVQYIEWMGGIILRGDLGTSLWTQRTLLEDIIYRIPVTFELGMLSMIIGFGIGIPIGIYSAVRQDTPGDYFWRVFAIMNLATPAFWLATILIVYGSIHLNWSPPIEYIPFTVNPIENLKILIIPAILTGTAGTGGMMRFMRTLTLEVLRQDYVRTAWAKGLKERVIIIRHAMRNAMIPLLTMFVPSIGMWIGGSVIMEQIFCLPGMGRYLLEVIVKRDYFLVSGTNLVFGAMTMFLILLTDLSYAWADPRIRYR